MASPKKREFCQVPKTFALSQNEKPKSTKKKWGAASLRPEPHATKSINFKFVGATRTKRFVASSCCARPLREVRPKRWVRRAALKKQHFAKFQRLSHFRKLKTQIDKNARGAQLCCAPNPMPQNKLTLQIFLRNAGKKICCKLSLRAAQALGAARHPQKNGILPNSKRFHIFAKRKTQTNPNQPKKAGGAASLRPKPYAAKSINFKFFRALPLFQKSVKICAICGLKKQKKEGAASLRPTTK